MIAAVAAHVFSPKCGPLRLDFADASQSRRIPNGPATQPQVGQPVANPTGWTVAGECVTSTACTRGSAIPSSVTSRCTRPATVVGDGDDSGNPWSIRYPLPEIMGTAAKITVHGRRRHVVVWSGIDRRCVPARAPSRTLR
jgi:hypothetical protein